MKSLIQLSVLAMGALTALSSTAFAEMKVDCSKAGDARDPKVVISGDERMDYEKAGNLAYKCFLDKNARVIHGLANAVAHAKAQASDQCVADSAKVLTYDSWVGERPDQGRYLGGEARLLVKHAITCDGVGSGMFHGIFENSLTFLMLSETVDLISIDNDTAPIKASIEIKLGAPEKIQIN